MHHVSPYGGRIKVGGTYKSQVNSLQLPRKRGHIRFSLLPSTQFSTALAPTRHFDRSGELEINEVKSLDYSKEPIQRFLHFVTLQSK